MMHTDDATTAATAAAAYVTHAAAAARIVAELGADADYPTICRALRAAYMASPEYARWCDADDTLETGNSHTTVVRDLQSPVSGTENVDTINVFCSRHSRPSGTSRTYALAVL